MNEKLLYVGCNSELTNDAVAALKRQSYEVHLVHNYLEAIKYAEEHEIDMFILDMKDMDSDYRVIRRIRTGGRRFPVIVLSYRVRTEDVVNGFAAGANDYINKPCEIAELIARVQNLLELFSTERERYIAPMIVGDLCIEPSSRLVMRGEDVISLSPKEYELLLYLVRNVNHVCSRDDILTHVWNHDFITGTNAVDVYIWHLRLKLDKKYSHKLIHSVRGVGYILKEP
ncbi:DNA-binding response OmpR family regulator [Paenibacillus sp. DS2015]|uniref:response regulator transcription factor n=1 Tax=Paenibacillus sp. DS2015 TaxID=3373917 RepID=UPI003D1D613C